jgi:RsiW-degrading membrane proteinase PrsW (M82 family)
MKESAAAIGRWSWLRVLIGGAFLFVLIERALVATGNINYVPSLLLVGTFTVPVSFCVLLYNRTKTSPIAWTTLGKCALWGGLLGSVIAGRFEFETLRYLGALPGLAVGLIEEAAKLLVPAYFILRRKYHGPYDGIMLGAAAGAGFAAFESMGYGLVALLLSGGNVTATVELLLFRSLMAPAAHIAWSGLLGGALADAAGARSSKGRFLLIFLTAVILHALWDSVQFFAGYIVLGLFSLAWLFWKIHKAERLSAFN